VQPWNSLPIALSLAALISLECANHHRMQRALPSFFFHRRKAKETLNSGNFGNMS